MIKSSPLVRVIVENEPSVPICLLGDPAYPLLPFIMKEFANRGRTPEEQFFGYRLSSARMVIECAFGRLDACEGTWILTSMTYLMSFTHVLYCITSAK